MAKRLPPLNAIKVFECAARHLSFTKAANELCVTQAAVSHQIKALEDFFGITFFIRKNRTLEITDLGKSYYQEISKILTRLAEASDKLQAQKSSQSLTISVPQTFGSHWLIPHLSEFNRLYPEIEVRIKGVDQDEGFLSNEVDIGIYYGRGNWDNLQIERLTDGYLQVLAAPELLQRCPILSKEDLRQHTLIHTHTRDNWQKMANHLELEELNIQHGPVFSHTFMALQAAIHGQGLVLATEILAQQELQSGLLQIAFPSKLRDLKSFYVVHHINQQNDRQIAAFRDWIVKSIQAN